MKAAIKFNCPTCSALAGDVCVSVGTLQAPGTRMQSFHRARNELAVMAKRANFGAPGRAPPAPTPGEQHAVGTGYLNWNRGERITDRYGTVTISRDAACEKSAIDLSRIFLQGRKGRLVAHVVEARESSHLGDLFRGFRPGGAVAGEAIELGRGALFFELGADDMMTVGLKPADGREADWLDPKALYRAHEQLVRLDFIEEDE